MSSSGKRVIVIRHGEECRKKKIEKIQTKIGLTNQGAVRTSLMPEIIHKLVGDEPYELHTYTHMEHNEPTSRAFYTTQLLETTPMLYEKSDDIKQLVENIKKSKAKNIIVFWEHNLVCHIMHQLIGLKPDWEDTAKKIYKKLGKKYKLMDKVMVNLADLNEIKYCSDEFLKENMEVRDYYIKPSDDISYSLVWDIDYGNKSYKVFPNYIIKKVKDDENAFKVIKYL